MRAVWSNDSLCKIRDVMENSRTRKNLDNQSISIYGTSRSAMFCPVNQDKILFFQEIRAVQSNDSLCKIRDVIKNSRDRKNLDHHQSISIYETFQSAKSCPVNQDILSKLPCQLN